MAKKPTPKQQRAAKLYAEAILEGKDQSQGEILKQAGYSKAIQKSPDKVTKTDGFQRALEKFMPMASIVERHTELMQQNDHLPTALKAVQDAYDLHNVTSEKGGKPYMQFIQVIAEQKARDPNDRTIDLD